MPKKRPWDGFPKLRVQLQQWLPSPWLVYINLAAGYIVLSAFQLIQEGASGYVPAFCFPAYCYPALPTSMIIFSSYLLVSVRRWGWWAGPYTAFAALMFDAVNSVPSPMIGLDIFWAVILLSFAYVVRPQFRPSAILVLYFIIQLLIAKSTEGPSPWYMAVQASLLELLWCTALWRSLTRRGADSSRR